MQDHQKESKKRYKEIQPRNHTRNNHDIIEREEIMKNAEAKTRQNIYCMCIYIYNICIYNICIYIYICIHIYM